MPNELLNSNDGKYGYRFKKSSNGRKSNDVLDNILCLKLAFFLLCLIAAVTLLLFAESTVELRNYLMSLTFQHIQYNTIKYVVLIDVGAKRSRLYAYRFEKKNLDNSVLNFDELHHEQRPGLFADNPTKAANSIMYLLDKAQAFVPENEWPSTPLILRVTAELQLLPQLSESKLNDLLNAARGAFANSEFIFDDDAVKILDDTDRAIFSWLSVDLLFNRYTGTLQTAALDVRDDSMQVAFTPTISLKKALYTSYMRKVHTHRKDVEIFSNNYPGLGLLAARQAVFTVGYDKNQLDVESICVNSVINNLTWTYGNLEYKVSGKSNTRSKKWYPTVDFRACYELVRSKVQPLPKPFIPLTHLVVGFGKYFEVAVENGLISPDKGGKVTVGAYRKKARDVCSIPNAELPFACFDLIYISVLLCEGFGLDDTRSIKLFKKIEGHELSWALGCAYNVYFDVNTSYS